MATPTEQNPVTQAAAPGEVRVIVVKLPFDLQERILSFPLLHKIREKYPKAEIHFISPKKEIEVLNLLPFTAYYHEVEEDDLNTIFDAHRYGVTANIYNVDIFISLTNSFVDACLGYGLGAKKRVGFSDGWKTMVLTHKTPRLSGHHVTEDYFALYRAMVEANVELKIKVASRDLDAIIPEWETLPYIAINLSPLRQATIEEEMLDLINSFENQRIVLFSSDDQEGTQLLLEPFWQRLSKKNTYVNFVHKSWIELAKMMAFSRGVITFNGPAASLSAYTGTRTVILYDSENPQKYAPFYFEAEILILGVNDPTLINTLMTTGILQERKRFNMVEVFGKAYDFFRLK
jgi:ADP-heptose:LPS heptosyltransferase